MASGLIKSLKLVDVMSNQSLKILFLISSLISPIAESKASMVRSIAEFDAGTIKIHVFCSDGKKSNEFVLYPKDSKTIVGLNLKGGKDYKNFKEFRNTLEYQLTESQWSSDNLIVKQLVQDSDQYCMSRLMSDSQSVKYLEEYTQNCVYPKRPEKYCFKK